MLIRDKLIYSFIMTLIFCIVTTLIQLSILDKLNKSDLEKLCTIVKGNLHQNYCDVSIYIEAEKAGLVTAKFTFYKP